MAAFLGKKNPEEELEIEIQYGDNGTKKYILGGVDITPYVIHMESYEGFNSPPVMTIKLHHVKILNSIISEPANPNVKTGIVIHTKEPSGNISVHTLPLATKILKIEWVSEVAVKVWYQKLGQKVLCDDFFITGIELIEKIFYKDSGEEIKDVKIIPYKPPFSPMISEHEELKQGYKQGQNVIWKNTQGKECYRNYSDAKEITKIVVWEGDRRIYYKSIKNKGKTYFRTINGVKNISYCYDIQKQKILDHVALPFIGWSEWASQEKEKKKNVKSKSNVTLSLGPNVVYDPEKAAGIGVTVVRKSSTDGKQETVYFVNATDMKSLTWVDGDLEVRYRHSEHFAMTTYTIVNVKQIVEVFDVKTEMAIDVEVIKSKQKGKGFIVHYIAAKGDEKGKDKTLLIKTAHNLGAVKKVGQSAFSVNYNNKAGEFKNRFVKNASEITAIYNGQGEPLAWGLIDHTKEKQVPVPKIRDGFKLRYYDTEGVAKQFHIPDAKTIQRLEWIDKYILHIFYVDYDNVGCRETLGLVDQIVHLYDSHQNMEFKSYDLHITGVEIKNAPDKPPTRFSLMEVKK